MASDEDTPNNHPGGPNFTQRTWRDEVAIALAESGELIDTREVAYEFSNGRKAFEPRRQG